MKKFLMTFSALALMAAPAAFAQDENAPPPPGAGKGAPEGRGPGGPGGPGERWQKIDKDGDGFISRVEFLAPAEEKFTEIDKDADGKISKEEMEQLRKERGEFFRQHHKGPKHGEPRPGGDVKPPADDAAPAE